jgi:basic membrane protein A
MNKKHVFSFLLLATMLLASMGINAAENPDAEIALVFSTGGLGDQSFNDAANVGKNKALTDFSGISVDQTEPTDIDGITSAIESYAAEGKYDLVIGIGFTATDGILASATAHTDVNFMIVDSVVDLPNVASIVFSEHEGSFLAGALAAMVSDNEDIGFLGGLDIPLINKFLAGYRQGARFINPDIVVRHDYSPTPASPWTDPDGGKAVAENFIELGSDVIYSAAGGTGIGVMTAAKEQSTADKKIYAIGVDSNQDHIEEGYVLTSMIKRVDVAVYNQIESIVDGTWDNGLTVLDLAAGGVGITEMEFTQDEANAEYEDGVTRMDKIDELTADIIDGTIVVASELDADFVTSPAGILPIPFYAYALALLAVPIIRRRK